MSAKTDIGVTVGAFTAFLLGFRRLAGAVLGVAGVYYVTERRPVAATAALGLGIPFVLWPNWPETLGGGVEKKLGETKPPPQLGGERPQIYHAALTGTDIGGGWLMLDVSASQSDAGKTMLAKGLPNGTTVPLVLSHGAPPVVYYATIIGKQGGTYTGQWKVPPPAGPQFIDFTAANVLL